VKDFVKTHFLFVVSMVEAIWSRKTAGTEACVFSETAISRFSVNNADFSHFSIVLSLSNKIVKFGRSSGFTDNCSEIVLSSNWSVTGLFSDIRIGLASRFQAVDQSKNRKTAVLAKTPFFLGLLNKF